MFSKRLKELRKLRGLSQAALSQQLGVTQQAVGKWETGRATPDPHTIASIAAMLGVSADYLLGVEGDRALQPSDSGQHVNQYRAAEECLIPVIGTVRAGYGALALEEDYGEEYARVKDPGSYFYLKVKGDSMEPRISDGDLALVHRQSTLNSGELGVVVFGEGEGTLKKYVVRGGTVVLQPFNPAYPSQILVGEDLDHLYIAGKVVETKTKW